MRNTSLALCVLSAIGLGALALPAQAMPLTAAPLGLATQAPQAEPVAWRRVCRPVAVRSWNGRVVYSNRCNNVWVGPSRAPAYAYGRPGYGPRPGYAPPPRPAPAPGFWGPPRPFLF